jgi:hypothetical protein
MQALHFLNQQHPLSRLPTNGWFESSNMTGTAAKARKRREQSAFSSDDGHTTPKSCPELEARNLTSDLDDVGACSCGLMLSRCLAVTELTCLTGPLETRPLHPFHGPEGWTADAGCGRGRGLYGTSAAAPSIRDISLQAQREMYSNKIYVQICQWIFHPCQCVQGSHL